jgi:hypothetical protein
VERVTHVSADPGLARYRRRVLGCDDDAHAFVRVPGEQLWACRRCGVQDKFFAAQSEADPPVPDA